MDDTEFPPSLQALVGAMGQQNVSVLVKEFGGTHVFVPKRIKPDHVLALALDDYAAKALSKARGGKTVYIPRNEKAIRTERDMEIIHMRSQGYSIPRLARMYNVTDRFIYLVLKKGRGA